MRPNLLLVIVDALRADRLGRADRPGRAGAQTPFLDTLLRRGVGYSACVTTCGWTLPACASIVTGRIPSDHGLLHHDRRFAAPKVGELLGPDWATFGVGNNGNFVPDDLPQHVLDGLGFERRPAVWKRFGWQEGFETYRWFHKEDKDGPFRAFAEWLSARAADPRPWFAMLHTNLVHDYDHDDPWCVGVERRLGRPLSPGLRKFRDGPWVWKDRPDGLSAAQVREELLAKYDGCVEETDRRLAAALAAVDLDRTVVVVVSDHGEGFDGERERVHHCGRLHDDLLRVPLLVVYPPHTDGAPQPGSSVGAPCSVIDVAPTLLALAGASAAGLPGKDLRRLPATRTIVAEDFGYLYLPGGAASPGGGADAFRRYAYDTHDVALRAELDGSVKRIDARIGRQRWTEVYDLDLDPEERLNTAAGPHAPLRRPERDEGAVAAALRDWRSASPEKERLAFPARWRGFVRATARRRKLPPVERGGAPARIEPITFFVVVDDPEELRLHVMRSAVFVSGRHQWLFVDNRGNRAGSSISRLYASMAPKARHDLRFHVHQDVLFPPDFEARVARALAALDARDPSWGVVGAAGRALPDPADPGAEPPNVGHWSDPHRYHAPTVPLPAEVQVLDELWLGVRASRGVAFDPGLPGFHCYGADLCMTARSLGGRSYVVDAPVVHKLWHPDGSLIERSEQSRKIEGRRTDAFRADFERSASYVAAKWARHLPFTSTCHHFASPAPGRGGAAAPGDPGT